MSPQSPVSSAAIDRENPWPGLASFTEDARAFFFGREKETDELVRLVRRNTLTVLFGQSGLGKSSLLQAGAFPLLREADYLPLYLRLDHGIEVARASRPWSEHGRDAHATPDHGQVYPPLAAPEATRDARASSSLADQVKVALVAAFKSVGADAPVPRADESLWEYFHRKDIDIWSAKNRLLTPILAFDQFEEIFTLGRATDAQRERGRAFLAELADLVENRPPAALRAKFDAGELDPARYAFDKPSCQVILSLREDFLPDLEGLKNEMRSIMHSRMRVRRLNGTQALEIVQKPAPHLLADDVAERIVEFVAGARGGSAERLAELEVEPALLSVICRELNERRRTLGQPQISADLVSGNRREILTDFYERSVADLPEAMRTFVEDHLLTKSGFRDNLALETALEFPGVTRPLIDTLVARRLVRLEDRLGVQRVELTHDVLAEVIRGSRDTRHQRRALEETKQRERLTRRRMWLARTIAAALLVGLTGVSWVAWRAIRAEREQERLRGQESALRQQAQTRELVGRRQAYASDLRAVQAALDDNNLGRARELLNRQRPKAGDIDLRGWEWRYLWQLCRSEAREVLGRVPFSTTSVASSADGNWIAAGDWFDGNLALWNRTTREHMRLHAGTEAVRVVFSPTAPLLAVGLKSTSGARRRSGVQLWSLETRAVVRELALPAGDVSGLVFSADGKFLMTSGQGANNELIVWRVADGSRVTSCPAPNPTNQNRWSYVDATGDLGLAAYGSRDGNLHVLDLRTGRPRWTVRGANERVLAAQFSPDGRTLATGAGFEESAIRLWDVESGREIGRFEGHTRYISHLAFSADGKTLFSSSGDQTLRVWEVATRRLLRTLRGHESEVWSFALLPDNHTLVSGAKDGSVQVWDTQSAFDAPRVILSENPVGWRFGPDDQSLVLAYQDGSVVKRSGPEMAEVTRLMQIDPSPGEFYGRPRFARRGGLLAQGTRAAGPGDVSKIKVWDWERGILVKEIASGQGLLMNPLGFSADEKSVVATNGSGISASLKVTEWDLASGREIGSWPLPSSVDDAKDFTVSDDGKQVVAMSYRDHYTHFDLATGQTTTLPIDLKRQPAQFGGRFSPDGRLLAAPSQFGILRVLDMTRPGFPEVTRLSAGVVAYHSALFSADQKRLVSGSSGKTAIMFWDVASFEPLLVLASPSSLYRDLEFSLDGNTLGAVSGTGGARALTLWRAPSWAEIEQTEAAERAGAGR